MQVLVIKYPARNIQSVLPADRSSHQGMINTAQVIPADQDQPGIQLLTRSRTNSFSFRGTINPPAPSITRGAVGSICFIIIHDSSEFNADIFSFGQQYAVKRPVSVYKFPDE